MMYRKKPVVIEAIQWNGSMDGMLEINKHWPLLDTTGTTTNKDTHTVFMWNIRTLEGQHRVGVGDYIIKGVKGEFYPCKPDIFAMTYESALAVSAPTQAQPAKPEPMALEAMRERKNAAYLERNQVVAALAKCFPSCVSSTTIEGWSEDWHGCVYIDLPTGQVSWHFHDSHAHLFDSLPHHDITWDGHTTAQKYERLAALAGTQPAKPEPVAVNGAAVAGWMSKQDYQIMHTGGSYITGRKTMDDDVALSATPGPARMLTEAEIFKTLTTQCINLTEACDLLQRKFCEVNNINLKGTP